MISLRLSGCLLLATALGCTDADLTAPLATSGAQPYVLAIEPAPGKTAGVTAPIHVTFSQPILPESLTIETFLLSPGYILPSPTLLMADMAAGNITALPGQFEFPDETSVLFQSALPLLPNTLYTVIITPGVESAAHYPFNQNPGGSPAPFVSQFVTAKESMEISDSAATMTELSDSPEAVSDDFDFSPQAAILINELFYDVAGVDTNGNLFVELWVVESGMINGMKLHFINGDDGIITKTLSLDLNNPVVAGDLIVIADDTGISGASQVPGADIILDFDPQNGPDAVQLVGPNGELLDTVGYGEPIVSPAENGMPAFEGSPASDVASGWSLSRLPDAADTNDNSADFFPNTLPSPGGLDMTLPPPSF